MRIADEQGWTAGQQVGWHVRFERRLTAVIDELNHRVKNMLATVQSLAAQTLKGTSGDPGRTERVQLMLSDLDTSLLEERDQQGAFGAPSRGEAAR